MASEEPYGGERTRPYGTAFDSSSGHFSPERGGLRSRSRFKTCRFAASREEEPKTSNGRHLDRNCLGAAPSETAAQRQHQTRPRTWATTCDLSSPNSVAQCGNLGTLGPSSGSPTALPGSMLTGTVLLVRRLLQPMGGGAACALRACGAWMGKKPGLLRLATCISK